MLIFLAVLVIFGSILEWLSLKDDFSKIRYHCVPSKLGCEPGEVFEIKTTVSNFGARTIPFLKMEELFPKEINLLDDSQNSQVNDISCIHSSVLFIRGRQKITRSVRVSLPQRGLYHLKGCRLLGGDFLGIRENSKEVGQQEEIIIFPQLLEDNRIFRALSGYYGDFSVRRFFIEDPILVSSYRDYTGREPMRSISWMQSAKRNQIMVKEFDHTMELSVTILLDVYLHWSEGAGREQMEYCFSLARTIAEFMEKKKVSYRLMTNAFIRNKDASYETVTKAGQGSHHYTTLLYTLGRAASNTFCNIDGLYDIAMKNYSGENAIFYIAPFENEKRSSLVKNLQNKLGCQVYPIYASALQEAGQNVG